MAEDQLSQLLEMVQNRSQDLLNSFSALVFKEEPGNNSSSLLAEFIAELQQLHFQMVDGIVSVEAAAQNRKNIFFRAVKLFEDELSVFTIDISASEERQRGLLMRDEHRVRMALQCIESVRVAKVKAVCEKESCRRLETISEFSSSLVNMLSVVESSLRGAIDDEAASSLGQMMDDQIVASLHVTMCDFFAEQKRELWIVEVQKRAALQWAEQASRRDL